ncbi:hypothetical protein GCAAIG_13510 [Candidatus Electronema halotolerans]
MNYPYGISLLGVCTKKAFVETPNTGAAPYSRASFISL